MTVAEKPRKLDLDQLRAREAELVEKVDVTRSRLDEYPAKIAEENRELVYAGKRPLTQLNSPLQKLRDAERKDATTLTTLGGELSAIRSVIAEESERLALEATAEARAALEVLHVKEEAAWQRGGELLGELAGAWNSLVEIVEEESQVATSNRLEAPGILAVEPVPSTFKAFLSLLHVAATDPAVHAEPHVQELSETGIFGRRDEQGNALPGAYYDTRPVGTQTTEVRRKLDEHDRLFHLIPDLRGIVARLTPSGRIPTITE
jgi:hypothetical protein